MMEKEKQNMNPIMLEKIIESRICLIRGMKVILDSDLAELYGVEIRTLNQNVRRNLNRFPEDFMFQLHPDEWNSLKSHLGMAKNGQGGRRFLPFAFTEAGVAMLSSVLNSETAIQTNVIIIRTFIKMRSLINEELSISKRLDELENNFASQNIKIDGIFSTLRQLLASNLSKPKRPIGIGRNK